MRRKLNVRLLLSTLALLLVVAGLVHVLHLYQVGRSASALLTLARQARDDKKIEAALNLYAQYHRQSPDDLDAAEEYALFLDAAARGPADRARVVALLEPLLLKSGDRHQARARLIDNLAATGRYEAAVRHIDALLPHWADAAELEHKRGWCLDAQGKHEAAARAYATAVERDPRRIASHLLLAEVLHLRLAREEEAVEALDRMVAENPKSPAAYLARFRHQRQLGRDQAAAADLAQARALGPHDADVLQAASQWAQARRDFDEARRLVEEGLGRLPTNAVLIKELAHLELRAGNRSRALEVVEKGLADLSPKVDAELSVFHADLLIDAGRGAEAEAVLRKLRSAGAATGACDFLQARLAVLGRRWDEACGLLDKARAALGFDPYWNSRVNALLGQCLGELGDVDRQVRALSEAARSDPSWTELTLNLAHALLRAGQPEQALAHLEQLDQNPQAPPETKLLLARALARLALQTPDKRRDWRRVDDALARAAKACPDALDRTLLEAEVLEARRKLPEARVLLHEALGKRRDQPQPDDLALWSALARLEVQDRNHARALAVLDDARKRFGDRVEIRLGRLHVLASRGLEADRAELAAVVADTKSLSPEDRGRLQRELGDTWLRLGNAVAAKEAWRRAAEEQPRDARSRIALLELALQENRPDQARHWLAELRRAEGSQPQDSPFAEMLIRIEEAVGQPAELRKVLKDLAAMPARTDPGRWALLEARLHDRLGDPEQARARLEEAVQAGVRERRPVQRLVELLLQAQHFDKASQALAILESTGPLPAELWRPAVEVAVANKDTGRVRDLLSGTDAAAQRDYRELVWLGRVLEDIGDREPARAALRRAVELAPHAVEPWVALVQSFVVGQERDKAALLLMELPKKAPAARRSYLLARAWEALGDPAEAEKAYLQALSERPDDFVTVLALADLLRGADRSAEAALTYRKVLENADLTAPAEVQARAGRGLALASAPSDPAQARSVLAPNHARRESVDERLDLYLQGLSAAGRSDAVRRLETQLSKGPATAEEQFLLAQLHEHAGNADRYQAWLDRILTDRRETPQMLAHYARHLLAQGQPERAAVILQRLQMREPAAPRTRQLLAQHGRALQATAP